MNLIKNKESGLHTHTNTTAYNPKSKQFLITGMEIVQYLCTVVKEEKIDNTY